MDEQRPGRMFRIAMAAGFDRGFRDIEVSEPIKDIVAAYSRNMERVFRLLYFPIDMIYFSTMYARAASEAGIPIVTGYYLDDVRACQDQEAVWRFGQALIATNLGRRIASISPDFEAQSNDIVRVSSGFINGFLHHGIEEYTDGADSLFYAMILNAYAAFEAMAKDLWLKVVDEDWTLASAVLNGTHRKNGETEEERRAAKQSREDRQARTVRLAGLWEYQFNLSNKMGQFLNKQGVVDFGSFGGLREAYQMAFGSQAERIFDQEERLFLAEKTRHLIAHRSGLIDETYKKHVKRFDGFGTLTVGEYLEMDGVQVAQLIDATVKTALELARFVDGHLVKADEKRKRQAASGPGTGEDVPDEHT